jgi:hypothetical protein
MGGAGVMAQTESSISRRDLLRKGAVAGAVAWTAPVVLSSPAFAATGKCSGSKKCINFRSVKFENGTSCTAAGNDGGCPAPGITNCAGAAVTDFPSGCAGDGITGSQADNLGTINIPAGIVPLVVHIKTGGNCYRIVFDENGQPGAPTPAPSGVTIVIQGNIGSGYTVTATKTGTGGGAGISHLTLYYCK